jgi:hypothetical protein
MESALHFVCLDSRATLAFSQRSPSKFGVETLSTLHQTSVYMDTLINQTLAFSFLAGFAHGGHLFDAVSKLF